MELNIGIEIRTQPNQIEPNHLVSLICATSFKSLWLHHCKEMHVIAFPCYTTIPCHHDTLPRGRIILGYLQCPNSLEVGVATDHVLV